MIAQGLEKAPVDCGQLIHNTEAFIPFSFGKSQSPVCVNVEADDLKGPANCVGKPLAMLGKKSLNNYLLLSYWRSS